MLLSTRPSFPVLTQFLHFICRIAPAVIQWEKLPLREAGMKKLAIFFFLLLPLILLSTAALGEAQRAESFLVISDTHLTGNAEAHAAMLEAVAQAARGRDAVLLLGDNTNNTHAEEHALVLKWAEEIKENTGCAVYILPGNHDYSAHLGPEEYKVQYGAYGWNQAFSRDSATASCAPSIWVTPGFCARGRRDSPPSRAKAANSWTKPPCKNANTLPPASFHKKLSASPSLAKGKWLMTSAKSPAKTTG